MHRGWFAVLAGALLAVACDNSGGSTTAPTVTTAPPSTVETFNGSVDPQGSAFNTFTVGQTGEVDVTLTAAGPPATIFMGLGIGVPATDGSSCSLLSTASISTQATTTPQLSGTASPGPLCVKIWDIGNQTATVQYTITVAHS